MSVQLGDLGTWVGSLGTLGAILFAYWRGHLESRELRLAHVREQATNVAAWVAAEKRPLPVKLSNTSNEPVYNLVVCVVLMQGAGPQNGNESFLKETYEVLPPGQFMISFEKYPGGGMHAKPGVEIAFTDKNDRHWLKDKNGALTLLEQGAVDYYKLSRPVSWRYVDDDKL